MSAIEEAEDPSTLLNDLLVDTAVGLDVKVQDMTKFFPPKFRCHPSASHVRIPPLYTHTTHRKNPATASCDPPEFDGCLRRDDPIVKRMHTDYKRQRVAANQKVAERLMQARSYWEGGG